MSNKHVDIVLPPDMILIYCFIFSLILCLDFWCFNKNDYNCNTIFIRKVLVLSTK